MITKAIDCHDAAQRWCWCRRANAAALPVASGDSQHLVEPFQNAGGNTGRLLVEPAGEIAQQPLGLVGVVELPGLPQRPADR
jgi:hypothetical protein